MGKVQVFPGGTEEKVELAYGVGTDYQGRGLAHRAVVAMLTLATQSGARAAHLVIATDNVRSQWVARRRISNDRSSVGAASSQGFRIDDGHMGAAT
jgi:hypothetical protein